LLRLACESDKQLLREVLYVVVSLLGVFTEILFWPLLAAQILWTMVSQWKPGRTPPRIVTLQALVIILGSPMWAHAVYRARGSPLGRPSLGFLRDYVSFGFLFEPDLFSDPYRNIPVLAALCLALFAAVCISRGLPDRGYPLILPSAVAGLSVRRLLPAAGASILIIFILALIAHRRQWAIALTGFVPIAAVLMPSTLNHRWPFIQSIGAKLGKRLLSAPGWHSPSFILAFIPLIIVVIGSFIFPLLASRLFLLFTPYVLIVMAVGIRQLSQSMLIGIPLAIFLLAIHVASIDYYWQYPTSSVDYQDLTQHIAARSSQGDLIFVPKQSWNTSPIFYYLNKRSYQFIADNFEDSVTQHPNARVWLIYSVREPPASEMREALRGYHIHDQVPSLRIFGLLYVRNPPS